MDFSKTYYKNQNYNNRIEYELSKTHFNNFYYNKKLKKYSFYYGKNSFIMENNNPIKTSPQNDNCITNKMIKTINKFKSSKSTKDKLLNKHLKNFHTQIIKLKIRKNRQFKSLFETINISSPNDNLFLSPQLQKRKQNLINLKLKSNKNKICSDILFNNKDSLNYNNSGNNIKEKNIKYEKTSSFLYDKGKRNIFINHKLLADDISRTHFTTMHFPSPNNKSPEKNISNSSNHNVLTNVDINIRNKIHDKSIDTNNNNQNNYIRNNNNILNKNREINNKTETNEKIIQNRNIKKNYNINNMNTVNDFSNNKQSFITSINYIQRPPSVDEFRKQKLPHFYENTKDLKHIKYCLYLNKIRLEKAIERIEITSTLKNFDLLKLMHFYKLFKPYNYHLEKYLIFLKEEINIEYKSNQKLKILKNKLLSEFLEERKNLLGIHKKLKSYLNDKFFLLCVKNDTLHLDLFEEKDKKEFVQDLTNFEILKRYISEISEIDFIESIVSKKKVPKTSLNMNNFSNNSNNKRNSIINKNIENYSFNSSLIHFKPSPIFESVNEFNDYMNKSSKKIEYLLMKDNKIGIEVANLRDYYLHHLEEINKTKYNKYLLEK